MTAVAALFPGEVRIPNDEDYGLRWVVIGSGLQAAVGTLTPDLARDLLDHNAGNRPLKEKYVRRYTSDIEAGRWKLNGEAIIVTHAGRMLSGQHRCHGVIRARQPITTVFIRVPGDGDAEMTTIDQSASRTLGDALRLGGAETTHGPTLRLIHDHLMGVNMTTSRSAPLSGPAALELAQRLPDIHLSVQLGDRVYREIGGSKAAYAAFHYLASRGSFAHEEFFERLKDGVGLGPKSPLLHLRSRILRERSAAEVMRSRVIWPLMTKAWNAWVDGRDVGVLRFGSTEQVEPIAGLPDEWCHGAWKAGAS